jgi:hypothetical protein
MGHGVSGYLNFPQLDCLETDDIWASRKAVAEADGCASEGDPQNDSY